MNQIVNKSKLPYLLQATDVADAEFDQVLAESMVSGPPDSYPWQAPELFSAPEVSYGSWAGSVGSLRSDRYLPMTKCSCCLKD